MDNQATHTAVCNICGKPTYRTVGLRQRTKLCDMCWTHTNLVGPPASITTYRITSPGQPFGIRSTALQERSLVQKKEFRLVTICTCGKAVDMSGQALGMTIACPTCGEKILLTETMKTVSKGESTRARDLQVADALNPPVNALSSTRRIGDLLVYANFVTPNELEEALALQSGQGQKLADNLITLGYLNRDEFEAFLIQLDDIRSIDLHCCKFDSDVLALIPLQFALDNEVCPIDHLGPLLTVGMACPHDAKTLRKIGYLTRLKVIAYLCRPDEIVNVLKDFHPEWTYASYS